MNLRLLASASALSLLGALASARAEAPEEDRFATEVLLGPTLRIPAPTSPAYALGIEDIRDPVALGLDTIVTGQIHEPGAGEAASGPGEPPASDAPSGTEHGAAPAAHPAEGGSDAAPAEHAPEAAAADAEHATTESAVFPAERGPEPFDIIRTVQFLQDQVARGNGRAIRVQAALLRRFGPVFLNADRKVWTDGRNRRAAVLFVLSGGPPEVLRRLLDAGDLDPAERPLVEGALAYLRNDLAAAGKRLAEIDLAPMEPGLAAHIDLVLGQILQTTDPAAAIHRLDQARLLAPGGLIEEAALRMEVLIVDQTGDHDRADRLARQYFDRYARSSYSANFEARFAAVYAARGGEDPEQAVRTILDVTARLSSASRSALLLAVARRSLVDGRLKLAELASDAAATFEDVALPERQRADLYAVAARLGLTPTNEAAAALEAIHRDDLHPEDAKLLDAASSVVAGIERSIDPVRSADSGGQPADSLPVFDRAQKLLDEVSADLGKANP